MLNDRLPELKIRVAIRADLEMPLGKLADQAGHSGTVTKKLQAWFEEAQQQTARLAAAEVRQHATGEFIALHSSYAVSRWFSAGSSSLLSVRSPF